MPSDQYGRSVLNSTSTPLGVSEEFTGEFEIVRETDVISRVITDADCTQFFEFSFDGKTVHSRFPPDGFNITANIGEFHRAVKGGVFFRMRIVNGSAAQTSLEVSTIYGDFSQGNLPLNATIGADADAQVVRAIDPRIDMALGRVGGLSSNIKFGRNPDIDTGVGEDIWNGGSIYTGQPVGFSPETVTVFSDSSADTAAGSGARTIEISGLKSEASTEYETETISLNGTTGVVSINTWWRVNRLIVLTAGSGGENAGQITVRATTTTANVFAVVAAGFNQSTIAAYTVPANKTMVVLRKRISITRATGADGSATISFRVRDPGGVYRADPIYEIQTGSNVNTVFSAGVTHPAGTDMKVRVENVSDNNTIAEASFEFVLIG